MDELNKIDGAAQLPPPGVAGAGIAGAGRGGAPGTGVGAARGDTPDGLGRTNNRTGDKLGQMTLAWTEDVTLVGRCGH